MKPADLLRLLALAAIWGASFLFMRLAVPEMGALNTAFFRVLFGAAGLLLLLAVLGVKWRFQGKLRATMLLGAINSGLPFVLFSVAAKVLPAGYSAILNATTPLMGVVIGALFFGDRLTPRKVGGVMLGLAGVAVLTRTGPVAFDPATVSGALACLLATSCYGLAGFLTKRWITDRGGLDSKLVAFGSQLGAVALLLPFFAVMTILEDGPAAPLRAGIGTWFALLILGFVCSALAYILFFRLIADIGPVKSLTVTFLIPLFGVLWGWLFLQEQLSWAYAAGGALIGMALLLVLMPAQAGSKQKIDGKSPAS
ncbi:multidrug DMT transporter permease [Herbaspirillum hiltneri N3]|uniref:Multidrug DMT transporter permease n=1 Tax=Herbaspirillum hiltneri N3 TaxID=1262470 RepID=A0ABN4HVL2_9BURK|nr:DMT family transporter [Herbaspirillum hiltneri]AKZ62825.1 multidrug DMT transporter permease [Herbaspirillum hiltneri N3]